MRTTHSDVDRLQGVLAAADEPMTAREILAALEAEGETAFESPHQIATVLGRWADRGEITVYRRQPYEYQLD
jgi:ABC-type xylose transport system substrate-binding protein